MKRGRALHRRYGRATPHHGLSLEHMPTREVALAKARQMSEFENRKLYVFQVQGRRDVRDGAWFAYTRPPMKDERIGKFYIVDGRSQ